MPFFLYFWTCLLCTILNLEVFGRLLGDSASKVQLVNLTVLVPHGSFVVHHNFSVPRDIARRRVVFASSKLRAIRIWTCPSIRRVKKVNPTFCLSWAFWKLSRSLKFRPLTISSPEHATSSSELSLFELRFFLARLERRGELSKCFLQSKANVLKQGQRRRKAVLVAVWYKQNAQTHTKINIQKQQTHKSHQTKCGNVRAR